MKCSFFLSKNKDTTFLFLSVDITLTSSSHLKYLNNQSYLLTLPITMYNEDISAQK